MRAEGKGFAWVPVEYSPLRGKQARPTRHKAGHKCRLCRAKDSLLKSGLKRVFRFLVPQPFPLLEKSPLLRGNPAQIPFDDEIGFGHQSLQVGHRRFDQENAFQIIASQQGREIRKLRTVEHQSK